MVKWNELSPYVSLLVARRCEGKAPKTFLRALTQEVEKQVNSTEQVRRSIVQVLDPKPANATKGTLQTACVIYEERRAPAWAPTSPLADINHHAILLCRREHSVAIFTSDPGMGRRLGMLVNAKTQESPAFSQLQRCRTIELNGAFLGNETRTIWLSGIHRRTRHKADSKILSGRDLRAALDPLGDQTYRFTAARGQVSMRCAARNGQLVVGVSPEKSRVWAGRPRDWTEFKAIVHALLEAVEDAHPNPDPIPVVASLVDDVSELECPYDISVIDPTLLSTENFIDAAHQELAEKWADRAEFIIVETHDDPTHFAVNVRLDHEDHGQLRLRLENQTAQRIRLSVELDDDAGDILREAAQVLRKPDWATIRFESGHTYHSGKIHVVRFQDRPFAKWLWEDFAPEGRAFDVKKEKPIRRHGRNFDPALIGTPNDESLFGWTVLHWKGRSKTPRRGWLVCDDGAGEIADFIHLDEDGDLPLVSLIHIKGSKSSAPDRQVSTSDYEVVTGQAVKNIRFLSGTNLADQLEAGKNHKVATAVWYNGLKKEGRDAIIKRLRELGSNIELQVVILQPRVTRNAHELSRAELDSRTPGSNGKRLRQLDALLLEAEAACRGLGAQLVVVGDGRP